MNQWAVSRIQPDKPQRTEFLHVAIRCLLNDGSWAIVSDSFSESDVGKWIDPEKRQ